MKFKSTSGPGTKPPCRKYDFRSLMNEHHCLYFTDEKCSPRRPGNPPKSHTTEGQGARVRTSQVCLQRLCSPHYWPSSALLRNVIGLPRQLLCHYLRPGLLPSSGAQWGSHSSSGINSCHEGEINSSFTMPYLFLYWLNKQIHSYSLCINWIILLPGPESLPPNTDTPPQRFQTTPIKRVL